MLNQQSRTSRNARTRWPVSADTAVGLGFRTDAASPVRIPQVGTFTPVLNNEGTDLAAALETIRRFGDREALDRTML